MRIGSALAVAALLVTFSGGTADEQKPRDPDLVKLQGKWELVYHETAGEADTDQNKWTMVVRGDKYTLTIGEKTLTGCVRIDSTKNPKQVEYATDEDGDLQEYIGIYELSGDTYKTCDVEKGKDRPSAFKTNDPSGQVAMWKRVKVID